MTSKVIEMFAPDLPTLARQINEEHAAVGRALSTMLERARRAGELLLQAKAQVGHGGWQPWLAEHFNGSYRTAATYMQVARGWDEIQAKSAGSAHLSLDGALKLLAEPCEDVDAADDDDAPPAEFRDAGAVATVAQQDPRRCHRCGGGLSKDDPDLGPCWSCRQATPAVADDDSPAPARLREPEPPGPTPEDFGQTMESEIEALERRNAELEALVESLQSGDLEREITAWSAKYARLNARLQQALTTSNELRKQASYQGKVLAQVRNLLGVEKSSQIVSALKERL